MEARPFTNSHMSMSANEILDTIAYRLTAVHRMPHKRKHSSVDVEHYMCLRNTLVEISYYFDIEKYYLLWPHSEKKNVFL